MVKLISVWFGLIWKMSYAQFRRQLSNQSHVYNHVTVGFKTWVPLMHYIFVFLKSHKRLILILFLENTPFCKTCFKNKHIFWKKHIPGMRYETKMFFSKTCFGQNIFLSQDYMFQNMFWKSCFKNTFNKTCFWKKHIPGIRYMQLNVFFKNMFLTKRISVAKKCIFQDMFWKTCF